MKIQSRKDEISKKRYERNIVVIFLGIVIILIIFFFYGVPLLINFSLLVGNLRGGNDTANTVNESSYLVPPILNPIPDATSSARIAISGTAISGQAIKLYVNGKYIDQTKMDNKKSFLFGTVLLDEGKNDIKAIVIGSDKKESDFSQELYIVYKNKSPDLEIIFPNDKQVFSNGSNQIKVEGQTNEDVRITVNNYWAIVDNKGKFSYLLNLQKGENKIKVTAVDIADNQTSKEITVQLNQ